LYKAHLVTVDDIFRDSTRHTATLFQFHHHASSGSMQFLI